MTTKRKELKKVLEDTQHFWKEDVTGSKNKELLRLLNKGMKIFLTYIFFSTCMFLFKPLLVRGTTIYYYYKIPQIPFAVSYAIEFYVTVVTMSMVIGCNLIIAVLIVIGAGQFSNLNAKMRMLDLSNVTDLTSKQLRLDEMKVTIKYHDFLMM